eukprot:TRINITY_DN40735_c0_g1_i1.p1 TRINITY_DN40735_c0_g1~~TRINITY_DN40735_c0_g1_i1.p1  ORF type:complete len:401 (-),score=65.65 TRINITY_DN40735_c0_g1_i1:47-1249(-)
MDAAASAESADEAWQCPVCEGSGELLSEACPLCCELPGLNCEADAAGLPEYYCAVCKKDLQSAICLEQHEKGKMHKRRSGMSSQGGSTCTLSARRNSQEFPTLTKEDFFQQLAKGEFRNIVVCTGAGVSTEAGIPDFRSPGGLFEAIRGRYGERFPEIGESPEMLLSRTFARSHPDVWSAEVEPWLRTWKHLDAQPGVAHHFCAWLHRRGWLRRIYTQNVDGLHTHSELGIPSHLVVEVHGALRDSSIVLYGDQLPQRFSRCCTEDFPRDGSTVDLVIVFGTSLQVAPFCGVPNMAPKGCSRVLVNQRLDDCRVNNWSQRRYANDDFDFLAQGLGGTPAWRPSTTTTIGAQKEVQLRPLWWDFKARRRWKQLCIESTCSSFVHCFFTQSAAHEHGLKLDS